MAIRPRSLPTVLLVASILAILLLLRNPGGAAATPIIQRLVATPNGLHGLSYDSHSAALWSYSAGGWNLVRRLPPGEWIAVASESSLLLISISGEIQQLIGENWSTSRIPLAEGVWIQAVVKLDDGFHAYSLAHSDSDRVFRSSDGLTWHATSSPAVNFFAAVAINGDSSAVYLRSDEQTAVAFHSDTSWTLHSFGGTTPSSVSAMAASYDSLLIAGKDSQGPAVWMGPPLSPLERFEVPIERVTAAVASSEHDFIIVGARSAHASSWSINSSGKWREDHLDFARRFIDVALQGDEVMALVESETGNFVVCLNETWIRC